MSYNNVMTDFKLMSAWRTIVVVFVCDPDPDSILGWLARTMAREDIEDLAIYNGLAPLDRAWIWELKLRRHVETLPSSVRQAKWEDEFDYPGFVDMVLHIGGYGIPLDYKNVPAKYADRLRLWSFATRTALGLVKMVPLPEFRAKYTRSAAPVVKQEEREPPVIWREERAPPGARKGRPAALIDPAVKEEPPIKQEEFW